MSLLKSLALLLLIFSLAACESNEQKAEDAYQRGLELMETGDTARAKVEFRNAVRLDPKKVIAQLQLGRLNLEEGSIRPAFRSYRTVVEFEPNNVEALIALSKISFLVNDWQSFERYAPRAVEAAPEDPAARVLDLTMRYRAAVIDDEQTLRSQLVAEATKQLGTTPDDQLLRRILIDGNLKDGRYSVVLEQLDLEIQDNPKDRDTYDLRLRILAELGDYDGVEDELHRMLEIFPGDEELETLMMRSLVGRGKIDEAEIFLRSRVTNAGDNEEPYISLVQFLRTQRGDDVAMAELEDQIAKRPENHQLRMMKAAMNFELGNRETAISEMEDIAEQEAGTDAFTTAEQLRYKGILARMLRETGNEVGARQIVEDILTQSPNDVEALKMQARWQVEADDTIGAITTLRTAIAEDPNNVEALTTMAWAYERNGDTQLMMEFLSLAVEASGNGQQEALRYATALLSEGRVDQAVSTLETALRSQPSDPQIISALGRAYLRQRDIPRARQASQALRQIDTPLAQTAANGIELELIALEQGTEQALNYLEDLANADSEDASKQFPFLRGLLQSGEVERAEAFAANLLAEEPDNQAYQYMSAVAQAAAGDLEGSENSLTALVKVNPEIVPAWQLLARLKAAQGDMEGAIQSLDTARESLPDASDLTWAQASYYEQTGDIDEAIALYEDLYARNSNSIIVANNLASMITAYKTDEENLARARTIARRLKGTDIPAFQDTYGWILHRSGETEEALPYLEGAAAGLPSDPVVQIHLGFAYLSEGRLEEAQLQLDKARAVAGTLTIQTARDRIKEFEQALAQN